ncbi:MAG: hypothetical protein M3Y89_14235 [Actinomycetota bacterium]|nr:hypothetical protein [Actinomycetota bacterium]
MLVVLAPVDEHLAGTQGLGLTGHDAVGFGPFEGLGDLLGDREVLGGRPVAVAHHAATDDGDRVPRDCDHRVKLLPPV